MNPTDEIRKYFSSMNEGKIISLSSFEDLYESWVLKFNHSFGVALRIDEKFIINEKFSNVRYHTETFEVQDETVHLLMLTSNAADLRYEFASLCAMFLDPGPHGAERERIKSDPIRWWQSFKELIGNKTYEKTVHSVLGELLVFHYLYSRNKNIEWNGPKGSSIDIEDGRTSHEVKSTLLRYDSVVEIPGQFQLSGKDLYLYFCRFEKSKNGISIDQVAGMLEKIGCSKDHLEEMLTKVGFEENSLDRSEKFKVLEMRRYKVDENFPVLDNEKLIDHQFRDHIVQVKYKIDLKGLAFSSLDISKYC